MFDNATQIEEFVQHALEELPKDPSRAAYWLGRIEWAAGTIKAAVHQPSPPEHHCPVCGKRNGYAGPCSTCEY